MGREVTFLDDIHRYKSYVFSDAYAGRGGHAAPRHRLSAGFRGLEFRLFYWRLHLGRGVCVWAWGTDIYIVAGQRIRDANYWGSGATTLEWSVPTPAPAHTFETLPSIR